jgi:hypothetical protein
MPNHPNIGAAPDVIDDIAPLKEINPIIRFEPKTCEVEPAAVAEAFVESPAASPDSPEDGTPLAPAASITKTQPPTSRIRSSNGPESSRLKTAPALGSLKVKPFASLRRSNPRLTALDSKARNSVSSLHYSPCRPVSPFGDIQAVLPATIAKQAAPPREEGNYPREDPQ